MQGRSFQNFGQISQSIGIGLLIKTLPSFSLLAISPESFIPIRVFMEMYRKQIFKASIGGRITGTILQKKYLWSLILCGFISGMGFSQETKIKFSGKVAFISDAPLEKIKATSDKLQGIINLSTNQFAFTVKVRTFEGFNSLLQQEHFNENYLESDKYPTINYAGKLLDEWDSETPGSYVVRSKGYLDCHGFKKEQIIENTITVSKNQITISSKFSVLLADFGISIPQVVHKKISEEILITVTASQSR